MSLFLIDVEATGISPYSGVMTEFGAVEFKSRDTFHGVLWKSEPDPENPAKPRLIGVDYHPTALTTRHYDIEVMDNFRRWVLDTTKGRPIFVSDNPAYDFQWINFYFDKCIGFNPFGHSGRRIADFWAGLQRDFYNTQKWKSYRQTPHDHNPVNDAMGNAEALATLLEMVNGSEKE